MATARPRSLRLLRVAGWLQIVLAVALGSALALTWQTLLTGPRNLGAAIEATLASADRSLAATEFMLQTNQTQILGAEKQLAGYATSTESMAASIEQAIPLLRAWGEDGRRIGAGMEGLGGVSGKLGGAIAKWGLARSAKAAGESVAQRGEHLRQSGDAMLELATRLQGDILPKIRQTAETLRQVGSGEIEAAYREVLDSVSKARGAIQQGQGMVSPLLMVLQLACGVYAAMALVLLSCGVTTVVLGHALAAEANESAAVVDHNHPAGL